MAGINLDIHFYGTLASYVNSETAGYANIKKVLPENITLGELLAGFGIPAQERGITFINGNLSALPGLQPDLAYVCKDNDRVAFFDLRSMWPYQYRSGAAMTDELRKRFQTDDGRGLHQTYQ
jgi:hypothetical protein